MGRSPVCETWVAAPPTRMRFRNASLVTEVIEPQGRGRTYSTLLAVLAGRDGRVSES